MNILTMSISGGAIILAVLLVRFFAKGRIPRRLILFLWGIAIIRLLIPFTIPFEYSIYSIALQESNVSQTAVLKSEETVHFAEFISSQGDEDLTANSIGKTTVQNEQPVQLAFGRTAINWKFAVYFGVGTLLLLGYITFSIVWRKRFSEACKDVAKYDFIRVWEKYCGVRRGVRIRLSGKVKSPLTYGILRPVILLPEEIDWKDRNTLQYVFLHEFMHIKHYDSLKKMLLFGVLCIHWFNPLVWAMFFAVNRDIELACDEAVIKHMGSGSRKAYACALLKMEESRQSYTVYTNAFGKNAVEERVKTIIKGTKCSAAVILASLLIISAVVTVFATSAAEYDVQEPGKQFSQTTESTKQMTPSKGLKFERNSFGHYAVVGMGSCADKVIVIPETHNGFPVSAINELAFADNNDITEVHIPVTVESIDRTAFVHCTSVRCFVVDSDNSYFASDENGVLYNKDKTRIVAFPQCYMGPYSIPEGVCMIGDATFENCPYLTELYLPSSLISFGNDGVPVSYCPSLARIDVSPDNQNYSSDNEGVLYNKDLSVLIKFPSGKRGKYSAPESVETIKELAIDNATMEELYFGGLKSIAEFGVVQSEINCLRVGSDLIKIEACAFFRMVKGSDASSVREIYYSGTKAEWNDICLGFDQNWNINVGNDGYIGITVFCNDGNIEYNN